MSNTRAQHNNNNKKKLVAIIITTEKGTLFYISCTLYMIDQYTLENMWDKDINRQNTRNILRI